MHIEKAHHYSDRESQPANFLLSFKVPDIIFHLIYFVNSIVIFIPKNSQKIILESWTLIEDHAKK